jgi:hypothetical protein
MVPKSVFLIKILTLLIGFLVVESKILPEILYV